MVFFARLALLTLIVTTASCLDCGTDTFANSTHCQECRHCEFGEQFYLHACNSTHDTVCGNCTVCDEDEYETAGCNETHNTICMPCSTCTLGLSFALSGCGPDTDADRMCQNCSRCEGSLEVQPCSLTQDAVCLPVMTTAFTTSTSTTSTSSTSTPLPTPLPTSTTILALVLTSELPSLTPAMLTSLGDALAAELGLPKTAIQTLRRRELLSTELTVRFRILAALPPERVRSMNLTAVARASGLPIVIRSALVEQTATPPPQDTSIVTTLAVVGGVVGSMLCVAIVVYSVRRPARVQDEDNFTDLELITMTMVHESIPMPRLSRPGGL